jgi:hypothetical protein
MPIRRRRGCLVSRLILSCSLVLASTLGPVVIHRQTVRAASLHQSRRDFRITSGKGFVKVPFDLFENNILIRAGINNSQPAWFIFDTGANINLVNERLFQGLGLGSERAVDLTGGGGGAVQGSLTEDVTVSLPGVEAYRQVTASAPLGPLPSYFGRDVEGIIGTPFIKNFVVEIDYARKVLTLYDPKFFNLSGERDAVELENRNGYPFMKVDLSLTGQGTITDYFMIDSGSFRSLQINKPFADAHHVLAALPKANTAEGLGGAGIAGDTKFVDARISSLRLGRYTISRPVVSVSQDAAGFGAGGDAGVMGGEVLRRFTVTLDYQSKRILLKPNAQFTEPYESDMSGLELVTRADDFKVIQIKRVRARFPADDAGLREGDTIVAINGRPSVEFDLDELSSMFKRAGRVYLLTIERGGRVMRVKLKMKRVV